MRAGGVVRRQLRLGRHVVAVAAAWTSATGPPSTTLARKHGEKSTEASVSPLQALEGRKL